MNDDSELLFMIGCPRSGTTWLQLLVGQHPGVASAHESYLFSVYVDALTRAWGLDRDRLPPRTGLKNILTDEARASLFKRNMLERLEGIIAAQVKPLEKIEEIKIMQLGGSGTTGLQWADGEGPQGGGGAGVGPGGSPTDEVINSALRYRVQAPMIDSLMNDIGIDGSNLAKSAVFQDANNMARAANEAQKLANAKKAEDDKKDGK